MDPSTTPAGLPPPGTTSNLNDPPAPFFGLVAASAVVHTLTLAFVLWRIYINIRLRRIHPEDMFLYTAWCFFVAMTGLVLYNSASGMAAHIWDVDVGTLLARSYHYNVIFICYALSGGFAKAAVFLQFKKISTTRLRVVVYWVIVLSLIANALAYVTLLFLYVSNCWPREKLRDPMVPGRCLDWKKSIVAIGAVNLVSDIEAFLCLLGRSGGCGWL